MKRPCLVLALALCTLLPGLAQISGSWQNVSRFVEFSDDGRVRIVLKPYYGFVYEDTGWQPCAVNPYLDSMTAKPVPGLYNLSLRYAGEKKTSLVPVALIRDSLYFQFYRKLSRSENAESPLEGFWQASGNADALRLYRSEPVEDFFCYYFRGNTYYRIRYWAADVRFKDIQAEFTAASGEKLSIPKFIPMEGVLYTCITSTGKIVRNYETGSFSISEGSIAFKPDTIVYAGTQAAVAKPLRYTLSPEGLLLALGEPYLVRAGITDLDAEIAAHNALRRPHRKPIFEFMKLDFYWDEIERIRNGNKRAQ